MTRVATGGANACGTLDRDTDPRCGRGIGAFLARIGRGLAGWADPRVGHLGWRLDGCDLAYRRGSWRGGDPGRTFARRATSAWSRGRGRCVAVVPARRHGLARRLGGYGARTDGRWPPGLFRAAFRCGG